MSVQYLAACSLHMTPQTLRRCLLGAAPAQLTTGVTTVNVLRQSTTYKGSVVVRALGGSGLAAHMHFKDGTVVSTAKTGSKHAKLAARPPSPTLSA